MWKYKGFWVIIYVNCSVLYRIQRHSAEWQCHAAEFCRVLQSGGAALWGSAEWRCHAVEFCAESLFCYRVLHRTRLALSI
ncbi:hypothetical protein BDZ97DRAFT_497807 [Flammula alnicola]|nr:hypothetical protein BDZ97DRAFT_497807 [Flammula alnicola]